MKLALIIGIGALGLAATSIAMAQEPQGSAREATSGAAAYASAKNANLKEVMPGVSMATVWGDPDTGAHGTITKFKPGYDAGMHTHTSDITVAVIKGAYLYKDEGGAKRVAAGDVIHIPGGHKHWSGGDKTQGAVFYEESCGKFDKVDVK